MRPSILILSGAGISADSGVATFRDAGGLWEGHRAEEVATPEAWARDRALVWRFYQHRRRAVLGVEPNAAHRALAELEQACAARGVEFTLVSQNVDDLHQRAGSSVLDMHGQLLRLACTACGARLEDREHLDPDTPLPCPSCGAPALRPDVVWFGEVPLHLEAIERAVAACTVFAAIGTSGAVYPAAGILAAAREMGARTHVLSLDDPDNLSPRDDFVRGRAVETVPAFVERLIGELATE
ncbi:MAG: NAD-dependent deacylase [Planctomycetota bacterium]